MKNIYSTRDNAWKETLVQDILEVELEEEEVVRKIRTTNFRLCSLTERAGDVCISLEYKQSNVALNYQAKLVLQFVAM